jgi:hypothetical protein
MATVRAETFDAEMFGKLVALFDSNQAGEAESAFRKAVLLCAKNGLHFGEAAGMAFGHGDSGKVAELEAKLHESADDWEKAQAEIERLRAQLDEKGEDTPEGEHVIDLPGRLRRWWRFWQFRLFVLTVAIGACAWAGEAHLQGLAAVLGWLCLFLFGAWSVAQFRKSGFGQMLLKWLVYGAVLLAGAAAIDNVDASARPPVFLLALTVALLLTLSKVSRWLGGLIRAHVWESEPMQTARGWF